MLKEFTEKIALVMQLVKYLEPGPLEDLKDLVLRGAAPLRYPSGPKKFDPKLDQDRVRFIFLFQFAVAVSVLGICSYLGVSGWMSVPMIVGFIGGCAVLGSVMWVETKANRPLLPGSFLLAIMNVGTYVTSLGLLAITWAILLRTDWSRGVWVRALFLLSLVCLAGMTFKVSRYAIRHQATPWFQFAIAVTALPLLFAWLMGTGVSWLSPRLRDRQSTEQITQMRKQEFTKRSGWAQNPGWTVKNQPLVVAVALSGGGYRAATVHAGLLQALEDHCVPIRYLSTVSGGSIIGAYYALGYRPSFFREKLIQKKPGLPDDLLAIHSMLADWFLPLWSSADTYSHHFQNVYFGEAKLRDTSSLPTLLVNATDIEEESDRAREVFYRDRNSIHQQLDDTLIADIVAASGAFPGAFQPKTILWAPASGHGSLERRRFVDGGVVENLGLEGLKRYFHLTGTQKRPDIIIISDVSMRGRAQDLSFKVGLMALLSRSQGISYDSLHHEIYSRLDKNQYIAIRTTTDTIQTLRSSTFRSKSTGRDIPGDVIAGEVARYETLQELTAEEVEKAFWLGSTLGSQYSTKIDEMRQRLGARGPSCPG